MGTEKNSSLGGSTRSPMGSGSVMVVGGAGYIGSHCVLDLLEHGYKPFIVDNFSMGNRDIAKTLGVPVHEGDIGDRAFIEAVLRKEQPAAVMHFAAFAYVGESVTDPAKYYRNNVSATVTLLEAMHAAKVSRFIFSSTCASYGIPQQLPITEETPQNPINPYGRSKLMVEAILRDFDHAYGIKSMIFRYFNAAGADHECRIGERHKPETHLIPLTLLAAHGGAPLQVFGSDYPTPDGTCIRDYIHISDIAQAHRLGFERLLVDPTSAVFNIGTGIGNSVKEVIACVERVSGAKVAHQMHARRAGDPPRLVASATKLSEQLGWKPRYTKLDDIVETAYRWFIKDRVNQ